MKQCWSGSDLAEFWTLSSDEKQLSEQRTQQGRLGLAVLLKFFQLEGRFPHYHKEVPLPAVEYVAEQLEVPVLAWCCQQARCQVLGAGADGATSSRYSTH